MFKRFRNVLALILTLLGVVTLIPNVSAQGQSGSSAPLLAATGPVIPGSYIVAMKPGSDTRATLSQAQVQARYVYTSAFNGFAAQLNDAQLRRLQRDPRVAYIEPDQRVTLLATQFMDANGDPWGLDRIDQRQLPLSGTYTYTFDGSRVTAYIIDTGIQANHPQFGSRAANGYDALGGTGADCNGHGTHIAGIIGAQTYGVAKNVFLRGVRVLSCTGSGSIAGVIAGVDWVRNEVTTTASRRPAVANMSLGGSLSTSLNSAVTNLINAGVFVSVAAGGSNSDACNFSPASVGAAFTTASSSRTDTRATSSNYGPCIDSYAPGVSIKSTWINSGVNTISGTSMAAAHVAGVAAQFLQNNPTASPATTTNWIINNSTPNVIIGNPPNTPNRLLYRYP